jgi:hypothetical protein
VVGKLEQHARSVALYYLEVPGDVPPDVENTSTYAPD